MMDSFDLDTVIRKVRDFPREGILFYDITSVLADPQAFEFCLRRMEAIYPAGSIDAVAAVEARGFLFGAPFALRRRIPLVLVRKKGKLPGATFSRSFELEYGTDTVEMQKVDLEQPRRVLLVDDLVATGGTLRAAADIIRGAGSSIAGVFCVIGLPFLHYERVLDGLSVQTLIDYESE